MLARRTTVCAFDLHGCCGTNIVLYILTLLKQITLSHPISSPSLPSQPTNTEPSNVGSLQQVSSKLHHWWYLLWSTGSLGHS